MKLNILAIEDEKGILDLISFKLTKEGFNVSTAENGKKAWNLVNLKLPDLILLDLMLPDIDGFDLCRLLKSNNTTKNIPIIILTAKEDESDIIAGLTLGADDYITKPFSPKILTARIKTVLRRKREAAIIERHNIIEIGDLCINDDQQKLFINDIDINLTYVEFRVIYLLASQPGRVFTRNKIIEIIHNGESNVTDRSIDNLILGIRKKLGIYSNYIETVWGAGYRFKSQ